MKKSKRTIENGWIKDFVVEAYDRVLTLAELKEIADKVDEKHDNPTRLSLENAGLAHFFSKHVKPLLGNLLKEEKVGVMKVYHITGSKKELLERVAEKKVTSEVVVNPGVKLNDIEREAKLKVAKEVRVAYPEISQQEAVKEASKRIKSLKKSEIMRMWNTFKEVRKDPHWEISSDTIKKEGFYTSTFLHKELRNLEPYGIKMRATIYPNNKDRRKWIAKFQNDPDIALGRLSEIAKKLHDMTLMLDGTRRTMTRKENVVVTKKNITTASVKDTRLIFYVAGLCMLRGGKYVEFSEVVKHLTKGNYVKFKVDSHVLNQLIKDFPEYFEKPLGATDAIKLAGVVNDTWARIKGFNPATKDLRVSWCVNSGLSIDAVKEYFPESYIMEESMKVGSKIFVIVANRGIESFRKLSELQALMREGDFPIAQPSDFLERLKMERKRLQIVLKNILEDTQIANSWANKGDDTESSLAIDRAMTRIENM